MRAGSRPTSPARRKAALAALLLAVLALGAPGRPASAAPLPPMAPVDVCGRIRLSEWLPPKTLAAMPGVSGSAGQQRSWPGRFAVVLADIDNPKASDVSTLLATSEDGAGIALRPGEVLLVLASDDRALLDGAKGLCVTGFAVRGDEGGTWTSYERLVVDRAD